MVKKDLVKKKFGFSVVETMIMIAVLAIVVAATTPIITRKLINNADIGASLGGGSHGRYEVYMKEVLTFGSNRTPQNTDGTKTVGDFTKEKNPSSVQNSIIIYERKNADFYKKMTGKEPVEAAGKTSTLYEEIKGVTPILNEDGTITSAKKNVGGKIETYVAGGKYIFEDDTYRYVANGGEILNTSKNRIIEGNYTTKFDKNNPDTNNTLWLLSLKSEDSSGGGVVGYEKVTDSSIKGELIVYEKKDDQQYKKITGSAPASSGEYKSTLYEEIDDAKPIKDKDGTITKAKIKINGKEYIVKEDSKYIFENPQTTYVKGILKVVNGVTTFVPDKKGQTIDKNKNRIIEGNFTERYDKNNPDTNNPLWHIKASSGNFDGDVTTIPWEKVVSGSKDIVDRPLGQDSDGNYVGEFTPPSTAVNTVLHAVGGGGAGGGPSAGTLNAYVNPQTANSSQIDIMRKQLAKRFREVAKKKGLNDLASLPDSAIVKTTNNANIGYSNLPSELLNDSAYILLNTANGTITVKVDIRRGLIFPHELLDYTKILGAQTQLPEIHDMPKWFDWQNITDGKFRAGAVACGGPGGKAGDFIWNTTKEADNFDCMRDMYGRYGSVCYSDHCSYVCGKTAVRKYCNKMKDGKCIGGWTYVYENDYCNARPSCFQRNCTCANTTYYTCPSRETVGSCPNNAPACPDYDRQRNNAIYTHIYKGGSGGAAPPCVWLASIINKPIQVSTSCLGSGYGGRSGSNVTVTDRLGENYPASGINGENGTTCSATVRNVTSYSVGGSGGLACVQNQAHYEENYNAASAKLPEVCANTPGCSMTNSSISMLYALEGTFLCQALPTSNCGKNGASGTATPGNINSNIDMCKFSDGSTVKCMSGGTGVPNPNSLASYGVGQGTGSYNYIYTWTIPYATNYLGYGEAGSAGEYATTKLSKIEGSLFIKLGKGGVWKDEGWKTGKKGPNGTDTVVRMGLNSITAKKVLVAKGGQGGRGNLQTNSYDLCYANDRDKACSDNSNVACCSGIPKTSQEVSATNVRHSIFETIKSFVGNSNIIGIGLGRGAQGAGTSSGEFEIYGSRFGINASADSSFNFKVAERIIYKKSSASATTGSAEGTSPSSVSKEKYKNTYLKPANVNFKGGDGAVIITW